VTRVVQPRDFGGPDQLELVEVDTPEPGDGEVRIAVRAIGVNPVDLKHYNGVATRDPEDLRTFGYEVAGVVEAVGPGVTGFAAGDEVVATKVPGNGYADQVVVPASGLLPKPPDVSFEAAASVPVAAGTAYHALEKTRVGAGDVVLAHGAAGGVGTMVVQLAVVRGARVIATASPANHDYLRELGAAPVAYGDGLTERVRALAHDGVDVALDLVGSEEALETSLALVPDRDRVLTIAAFGRARELGIHLIGNGPGADPGFEVRAVGRQEALRLMEKGTIGFPVIRTFPLAETAEAHRATLTRHSRGKIVVVP
jgi:NADPH:quinone reductase-like Zn-dependent oxidoreductase